MKKTALKVLCLVLTLISLVSLFACGKNGNGSDTVADTTAAAQSGEQSNEQTKLEPVLPDVKYNTTLTIASELVNETKYTSNDIVAGEQNADYINDAIYLRTDKIQDQFGVIIDVLDVKYSKVVNSVTSGSHEYDVGTATLSEIMQIVNNGASTDLYDVASINLDNPWWDQNAQQKLCIGSKLFYTLSDFFITGLDNSRCFYFNKDIAKDVNAGNLYELVEKNEWNIEKLRELSMLSLEDLNGDGKYDTNDKLGMAQNATTFYEVMLTGVDCEIMKQGSNGIPYFMTFGDNKNTFVEVYTKLLDTFSKDKAYFVVTTTQSRDMFITGNLFFTTDTLMYCSKMRQSDTDVNFGIMPVPKLNAEQERYLHVSPNPHVFFIVPGNEETTERTGVLLEALSYYSSSYWSDKALIPAYFDLVLTTRNAPDVDSSTNLQIVHDNISYVIKIVGTDFSNAIYGAFANANYGITALLKSQETQMLKKLASTLEALNVSAD